MKKFIILLFLFGCGGGPVTAPNPQADKTTIVVKTKDIIVLSQADWHNQFRQQAVITDVDSNEYRFNVGPNLAQYNRLLINKKFIVYSYNGHLSKVEEYEN
jgi:hypothetical protein